MISVSCDREGESEREREVRLVALLVSVWHCHRRVEWDDVIQLLEKLDPPEADDDAVWQFLEDAHTPQSEKKEALYV